MGTKVQAKTSNYVQNWEDPDFFFMLALLKPIIFTFLRSKAIKQLALDIVKAAVKKTDNDVDDQLADMLEKALFPGR